MKIFSMANILPHTHTHAYIVCFEYITYTHTYVSHICVCVYDDNKILSQKKNEKETRMPNEKQSVNRFSTVLTSGKKKYDEEDKKKFRYVFI